MTAGLCTPHYAAPECAFGNTVCMANTSQDMWAFGAVAFELRGTEFFAFGNDDASRWRCVAARIGAPPRHVNIGPWQKVFFAPAERPRGPAIQKALGNLAPQWGDMYVKLVSTACQWIPERRSSATDALILLQQDGEAAPKRVDPS